tara:strand:+ start:855 stop:1598 length:744 start_codon:yes stop_codon:yes gene_type:complete
MKNLLIIGGTTEARQLAELTVHKYGTRLRVITSWAGRSSRSPDVAGESRIGGFGGVTGLLGYLKAETIDMVLDASHPFANQISKHVYEACTIANVPNFSLVRSKWDLPNNGKCFELETMEAAAKRISHFAKRVFLTTGRQTLRVFGNMDNIWFLVRLLERPKEPLMLNNYTLITGFPPFSIKTEKAIMKKYRIDTLISKSSGGEIPAKIKAALELDLTTVLVSAPPLPPGEYTNNLDECLKWISSKI